MPTIEFRTDANGMGFDEVARARMILASVGKGDAPTVEETVIGAMSWLPPPEPLPAGGVRCAPAVDTNASFTDQCCKREESSCQLGAVHTWHKADIPSCTAHVRFRG